MDIHMHSCVHCPSRGICPGESMGNLRRWADCVHSEFPQSHADRCMCNLYHDPGNDLHSCMGCCHTLAPAAHSWPRCSQADRCRCNCPDLYSYMWLHSHMVCGVCKNSNLGRRTVHPSPLYSYTAMAGDMCRVYRLDIFYTLCRIYPAILLCTHTLQVWSNCHSPHCIPPDRSVLRSIPPSNQGDRITGHLGCRCSGQNGHPWACIFWNNCHRSNFHCRWTGKNTLAPSASRFEHPETNQPLLPTFFGWQKSLSASWGCRCLQVDPSKVSARPQ